MWWSLSILRHAGCVDLTLAVCNPTEAHGCLITNTRRLVAYSGLAGARDYVEFVARANAE